MVPDVVRLKYKYELYTSRYLEEEKIRMRAMSYLIMLGDIKQAREIKKKHNYPIELNNWYNYQEMINANAKMNELNEIEVINHLNSLLNMIDEPKFKTLEWIIW
jgi:hypothetical protein